MLLLQEYSFDNGLLFTSTQNLSTHQQVSGYYEIARVYIINSIKGNKDFNL